MSPWTRLEARLREYAKRHNVGPTELARRLGYDDKSRSWGSEFLAGNRGLAVERLEQVADLFATTVSGLFVEEPAPLSPEGIEVAKAYESSDPKSRKIVRVALGLELKVKPVRKEAPSDQPAAARAAGRRRRR